MFCLVNARLMLTHVVCAHCTLPVFGL